MNDNFNSIEITSDTVYLTISGDWTGKIAVEESLDGQVWADTYAYLTRNGAYVLTTPYISKYLRARPIDITGSPIIQLRNVEQISRDMRPKRQA